MRYIHLNPQRLYCPSCEETYALPSGGTIKLYKELKCPLDKFELVYFSLGNTATAQGKGYPLCPYCYNHPPEFSESHTASELIKNLAIDDSERTSAGIAQGAQDGDASGAKSADSGSKHRGSRGMGCNSCMHPSCAHSASFNGVCPCPGINDAKADSSQCPGTLVFDENSKPNWKLACNVCNTLLRFHGNVHNVKPHPPGQDCEECGVRLMTFEFNKLKPLPSGELSRTGCIVCDDTLNGLTEIIAGRSMNITVLRQMRARRAASGRGGRGRGRSRGRGRGKMSRESAKMSFADF
jgi:DNA topoisomerase-3